MAGITLRTARQVVPMIYAYTTPEIARHNGWTKIGYTEQSVDKRLKQQTHTADVLYHEEWRGNAVYDDGSGEVFTDHDFHAYLRKLNVENDRKNEWFHLDGQQSRRYFQDFRMNRGRVQLDAAIAYTLREEQARAVHDTKIYYQSHPGGEYLWNAKPRFGKTLSVYDFCKQVDAQTVLIVTNRPAIANSWYSDYVRFLGRESGYLFVSHVDALAGQPHVLDEQGYLDAAAQGEELYKRIEFVSLQDMKGSKYFGGEYDKLQHLTELNWDVLVIDEAHEGVDTYKTDLAFDRIRRKFTLHLSGTPFKALANDKFAGDAMGFQSNFLFQNISNVFSAPQEVLDILQNFQSISEAKAKPIQITPETGADLSLNDKGEVDLDEGYVIGKAADVFGEKIYESTPALDTALQDLTDAPAPTKEEHLEPLKKSITKEIIAPMVEQAKQEYGRDLKLSDQKRFESTAKAKMDVAVNKVVDNYRIDQSQLETQRTQQLQNCTTAQQRQQVNREFDAKQQQSTAALMETLQSTIQQTAQEMQQTIVRTVETNQKEQEKKGYEDTVRDHLRGFSRTIPSFLMAYGDETVTLANFDQIIPDKVFQEVTSITLEQFRFLRDGGPYINQATGQEEHFAGHLFDPVVFDDSVKEFLNLKVKLADYFDESRTEDIFDYIPPQKTNQIFTPKWVVKKMVDLLEQENPGCFDDPGKTFLDPYMKSGLYITEIVKRLYRSEKMRQAFPDDNTRLEHIFAKQVYGLAPTEIIYRIAISYILGFAKDHGITAHHIRQADTLEFAKAGTMERELGKIFRD